jgi:hypothetical protein
MDDFVALSIEIMKKERYIPKESDFRYLIGFLNGYSEIENLLIELRNLRYKPNKRMITLLAYFTDEPEQCLSLLPSIEEKEKFPVYRHLICMINTEDHI